LEHFSTIKNPRDAAKVRHSLSEVLLLVVSTAIAGWNPNELALLLHPQPRYPDLGALLFARY
jgi:hypothetical protein